MLNVENVIEKEENKNGIIQIYIFNISINFNYMCNNNLLN